MRLMVLIAFVDFISRFCVSPMDAIAVGAAFPATQAGGNRPIAEMLHYDSLSSG